MAAKAAPAIMSQNHVTEFELDELGVQLIENGDPAEGKLELDNFAKSKDGDLLVTPGKVIDEEIAAKNTKDYDQYVRLVIRRYWVDAEGEKTTELDPDMIELTYDTANWTKNDAECTAEMDVVYYNEKLAGGDTTEPAVTQVRIADGVIDQITEHDPVKEGDKTIYTYEYKYNGYSFMIEAEAQAVQTHNKDEAIKSIWGIDASDTPIG